mgnify:CR=1 FL=1
MREALARSNHDFVLSAPRRPQPASHREPGAISQLMSAMVRHPKRTFMSVVFTGVFCGIAANALFFQTARHPAPIFAGPVIARPMQQQAAPVPPPVPRQAEAPMPSNAIAKLIDAPAPAASVAPIVAPQTMQAPAQTRSSAAPKDQIGALIGGLVDDGQDPARVMAVQKALVKLGYVVRPDGVMGNGTRQALQMFEQSRKLTVTGELTPRTLRELGAQSGIAIP